MTPASVTKGCLLHFSQRVAERIHPRVDAKALFDALTVAIKRGDDTRVTFIKRLNRKGRRLWRFRLLGETYFAVFDHSIGCPITILLAEGVARTHGDPVWLEEYR